MALYKVGWKAATREATVFANTTAYPTGFVDAGTFNHDDDANDALHFHGNHAVWHHVRNALHKTFGVQNMQNVSIKFDNGVVIAPPT
jgi:hypothetical protein